jgi:hypothetical protein
MRAAFLQRSRELTKPAVPSLALPRSSLPDLFLTGNRSHGVSSSEVAPYRIRQPRANLSRPDLDPPRDGSAGRAQRLAAQGDRGTPAVHPSEWESVDARTAGRGPKLPVLPLLEAATEELGFDFQ